MGIFDRFGGRTTSSDGQPNAPRTSAEDEQAIARYRYLLKTAPPETLEQAHAEAFARLSPEQRRRVLEELTVEAPEAERAAVARSGDAPGALARAATRAEVRQPGAIERALGRTAGPGGVGLGGMLAGSLLGSLAGTVLGTMVAQNFLEHAGSDSAGDAGSDDLAAADDPGGDFGGGFDDGGFDV
jgi:hypothetical protein